MKIYADFECILKGVKSSDKNNGSCTEKYQDHIPISFACEVAYVGNKCSKKVAIYRGKKLLLADLLKQFLKSMIIVKK